MPPRYISSPSVTYRVLPPKWRILKPEGSIPDSTSDYLHQVDRAIQEHDQRDISLPVDDELVNLVFANQLQERVVNSDALAQLILSRTKLTQKHLDDLQWRIDDLHGCKPVVPTEVGRLAEVEKMIIDLERQKRQVQLNEWRDLIELRRALTDERRQYHSIQSRANYLAGGYGVPD